MSRPSMSQQRSQGSYGLNGDVSSTDLVGWQVVSSGTRPCPSAARAGMSYGAGKRWHRSSREPEHGQLVPRGTFGALALSRRAGLTQPACPARRASLARQVGLARRRKPPNGGIVHLYQRRGRLEGREGAAMSPTPREILESIRRTAGRVIPGLPQPPTHGDPGGVVIDDRPHNALDPMLEPYAEMKLVIGSNFGTGYMLLPAVYDLGRHRFRDSYLHDPTLSLFLSAEPGLLRHRSTLLPGNPIPRRRLPAGRPAITPKITTWTRISQPLLPLERQIQGGPDGGLTGGGDLPVEPAPPLEPPEEILAYDWVVSNTDTAWSKHLIVENPGPHDVIQSLELDGVGTYSVRMRVLATRNRFFEKTVTFTVQEKFIIGIGDSFAAGEGSPDREGSVSNANPLGGPVCDAATGTIAVDALPIISVSPMMDEDPVWLEPGAHRSFNSHHARAALSLQEKMGETWNEKTGPGPSHFNFTKVTFASFARSGATIRGSLLSPQGGERDFIHAGQIEELRRSVRRRPIDALLISIGGNDAGFSGVLTSLVKDDSVYTATAGHLGKSPAEVAARLDVLLGMNLPPGDKGEIEVDLETLHAKLEDLKREVPIRDIYINGYPEDLFFVKKGGRVTFSSCGIFETQLGPLSIGQDEATMIQFVGLTLNRLLERKAREFGWHFIPLAADFAGKGYCFGGKRAMWIQATQSCRTQGDFDGTMHPTHLGHATAALRYRDALLQHTM